MCLPDGINATSRVFIQNRDGHDVPVGLHKGDWQTSDLFNRIMKILIEEALGYHAFVHPVIGSDASSAIYALAGCTDFDDRDLRRCGEKDSEIHVDIESWIGSYLDVWKEVRTTFPLFAPKDLGSLGYEGEESVYLTKDVLDTAYNDSGLALDYFKSYNRRYHNPNKYFGTLTDVPRDELYSCNDTSFSNPIEMKRYENFTGDVEGVRQVFDGAVAHCFDGHWWAGPSCRDNVSQCFPMITAGTGWKVGAMMQWVAAHHFPAAIAVHKDWGNHVNQVKSLFYWWGPDATFIDLQPTPVVFPPHSAREWAQGNKRTGAGGTYIAKLVSRNLESQSRKTTEFIKKMNFEFSEVQELLFQMTKEPTDDVACRWVKENQNRWREWLPVQTQCFEGFGLVDVAGAHVTSRADASGCGLCPAGRASEALPEDGEGQTFWCMACAPGYHQGERGSTTCEPCRSGTKSTATASTVCEPCPLSTYQNVSASAQCTSCDPSRTTMLLGAASREDCVCKEGWIDQGECVRCTEGLACPMGSTIEKLQQNNVSEPTSPHLLVGYVSTFERPLKTYLCREGCPGGAPNSCSGGLQGLTCGECPKDFYKSSGECHPCNDAIIPHLLWSVPVLYVLAVCAAYYITGESYEARATEIFCCSMSLTIALSLFQNMAVLGTISLEWPATSTPILQIAKIVLLDLEGVGTECAAPGSVLRYTATVVGICSAVAIIPVLGALSRLPCLRRRGMSWKLLKTLSITGGLLQAAFTTMWSVGLMPFMCYEHPNGERSLLKHSNVFCGSAEQQAMGAVGALLLTLVGSFFMVYVYGVWTAPSCAGSPRIAVWRFVIHRFKPNAWWFGLVILARGTLVSMPAVLATNTPSIVITLMLCVQHMYLILLLSYLPWKAPILNMTDGAVTGMLVVLLALALEGLDRSNITDMLRNVITLSIVVTLLGMFLFLLALAALKHSGKADMAALLNLMRRHPEMQSFIRNFTATASLASSSPERLEAVLQSLCYYDFKQVVNTLDILSDELELQVSLGDPEMRVAMRVAMRASPRKSMTRSRQSDSSEQLELLRKEDTTAQNENRCREDHVSEYAPDEMKTIKDTVADDAPDEMNIVKEEF